MERLPLLTFWCETWPYDSFSQWNVKRIDRSHTWVEAFCCHCKSPIQSSLPHAHRCVHWRECASLSQCIEHSCTRELPGPITLLDVWTHYVNEKENFDVLFTLFQRVFTFIWCFKPLNIFSAISYLSYPD